MRDSDDTTTTNFWSQVNVRIKCCPQVKDILPQLAECPLTTIVTIVVYGVPNLILPTLIKNLSALLPLDTISNARITCLNFESTWYHKTIFKGRGDFELVESWTTKHRVSSLRAMFRSFFNAIETISYKLASLKEKLPLKPSLSISLLNQDLILWGRKRVLWNKVKKIHLSSFSSEPSKAIPFFFPTHRDRNFFLSCLDAGIVKDRTYQKIFCNKSPPWNMSSCGRLLLLHLCYFINISEMGKSSGLKKFMPDEFFLCKRQACMMLKGLKEDAWEWKFFFCWSISFFISQSLNIKRVLSPSCTARVISNEAFTWRACWRRWLKNNRSAPGGVRTNNQAVQLRIL